MKLTWIHYWDEAIERLDCADLDLSFKVALTCEPIDGFFNLFSRSQESLGS